MHYLVVAICINVIMLLIIKFYILRSCLKKMSWMLTRKGKIQTSKAPIPTSVPESFNVSETNNHYGVEHYLSYTNILDMFWNERFPPDDPNIDKYKNILKSDIHMIAACPELFPYKETYKWCFSYLQKDTILIINAS